MSRERERERKTAQQMTAIALLQANSVITYTQYVSFPAAVAARLAHQRQGRGLAARPSGAPLWLGRRNGSPSRSIRPHHAASHALLPPHLSQAARAGDHCRPPIAGAKLWSQLTRLMPSRTVTVTQNLNESRTFLSDMHLFVRSSTAQICWYIDCYPRFALPAMGWARSFFLPAVPDSWGLSKRSLTCRLAKE